MITASELRQIMPLVGTRADEFAAPLNRAMAEFEINNPLREAAFLAQVAHESGEFRWLRELASGAAYDTGELAKRLGNTPEADGDGQLYKGRGPIQITGKSNYRDCGLALGLDLLGHPELLEQPGPGCRAAGWFWSVKKLNALADQENFLLITKRINGGTNGWADRLKYYERAKKLFSLETA